VATDDTFDFQFTPSNKTGAPDLEDDDYEFTITEIVKAEDGDPKFAKPGVVRAKLTYVLDAVDDDGANIVVHDWINCYVDPKPRSKLYQLASAVLFDGKKVPENSGLSASQLRTKRGRLMWGTKPEGDGKGPIGYRPIRGR